MSKGDIVHKATNLPALISKNTTVGVKASCKVHNKTYAFWFSHWWKDVNCKRCLKTQTMTKQTKARGM